MALTVTAIKSAKPGEKARRLADGSGLYLEISPSGGKYWRLKYRFAGKEKRLAVMSRKSQSVVLIPECPENCGAQLYAASR